MKIVAIELEHKRIPIEIRERLAFNHDQMIQLLQELKCYVSEVFILSTCNRWAVYAFADSLEDVLFFFDCYDNIIKGSSHYSTTKETVRHFFSTAVGLNSQIIGEHEILGQIKKAKVIATEAGTLGPVLDEFIRESINAARRIRNATGIGQFTTSIASASCDMIERYTDDLSQKNILIFGTGSMARSVVHILSKKTFNQIFIASHSMRRAGELANKINARPILVSEVEQFMEDVDIVIGGTHYEINFWDTTLLGNDKCPRDLFKPLGDKNRLFIDMGLPRNFNPEIRRLKNVQLFDLDDIKSETISGVKNRLKLVPQAVILVERETNTYLVALENRKISSLYAAYSRKLNRHKLKALEWLQPKLSEVNNDQWILIERMIHNLIKSVSKGTFSNIRTMVNQGKMDKRNLAFASAILDLDNKHVMYGDLPICKQSLFLSDIEYSMNANQLNHDEKESK